MYDELLYHLDLCILSYQLHAQTLIWPADPYYEQQLYYYEGEATDRRKRFMAEVQKRFRVPTLSPLNQQATFRGPGYCIGGPAAGPIHDKGWDTNPFLDPIISDYSRINPWRPGFTRPFRHREPWIVYDAPEEITSPIGKAHMMYYDGQKGPNLKLPKVPEVVKQTIFTARPQNVPQTVAATDVLYGFEGGTGATAGDTTDKRYASWSLMGFVLARKVTQAEMYGQKQAPQTAPPAPYDVHIVFRGSRSGDPRVLKAITKEKGNPDWVTDGAFLFVREDEEVSKFGSVCNGFSASLTSMLRTVMASLVDIQKTFQTPPAPPRTIYVTGHSLGGALACHFASAVILGEKYGLGATGADMPDELRAWPWQGMQVITYGSPVVGGRDFSSAFNNAIACRRVWLEGDPVTQERRNYAVGIPYRIPLLLGGAPKVKGHRQDARKKSHEPKEIRKELLDHRKKHKFPVNNVPTVEPWQVFESCYEMVNHVDVLAQNRKFGRPDCFPKFTEHLQTYFQILHDSIGHAATKAKITAFNAALRNLQAGATAQQFSQIEQLWVNAAPDIKGFDAQLYRFLGLCLALACYGESGLAMYLTGPFADLLKSI